MNNGFIKKSVESGTLGNTLKKMREASNTSLESISSATKIQTKYLKWLEEDNYTKLPAQVYVEGFLKSYAKFLDEDPKEIIKIFRKEQEIRNNIYNKNTKFNPIKPLQNNSVIITSKTIAVITACLITFFFAFYLYYQARFVFAPPKLEIYSPEKDTQTNEKSLEISGKSIEGSQVYINGQAIFTDELGNFKKLVPLQEGMNTLKISAENRAGKKTEIIRNIIYNIN